MSEEEIRMALKELETAENGSKALTIVNIASYFASDAINTKLFLSCEADQEITTSAIKLLERSSLARFGDDETQFKVSNLVGKVVRDELKMWGREVEVLNMAVDVFLRNKEDYCYIDHFISLWSYLSSYKDLVVKAVTMPLHIIICFVDQRRYDQGYEFGYKAIDILKRYVGENHKEVLDMQFGLGSLLVDRRRFKEALDILMLVHSKYTEYKWHKEMFVTLFLIARSLEGLNQFDEVMMIYESIFDGEDFVSDAHQTEYIFLLCWYHYANFLCEVGQYEKSLSILWKIVEVYKAQKLDKEILVVKSKIAKTLCRQSKPDIALKLLHEIHNERVVLLGEDDITTKIVKYDIAVALLSQGKHSEALTMLEVVLMKFKDMVGLRHPLTLDTETLMAEAYFMKGETKTALKAYMELYAKLYEIYGEQHQHSLFVKHKIESLLQKQNNVHENIKYAGGSIHYTAQGNFIGHNNIRKLLLKTQHSLDKSIYETKQNNDIKATIDSTAKLFAAAKIGEAIEFLQQIENVNVKDAGGYSPIHWAANKEHAEIVIILLGNGANICQLTNKGNTPLHMGALKRNKVIVDILIKHAAGNNQLKQLVDAKTTVRRTTALHIAAANGSLDIVKCLLSNGAGYLLQNADNKTAKELTNDSRIRNLLQLIEDAFEYAKTGNKQVLTLLADVSSDDLTAAVNAQNNEGKTLIQVAILNKKQDLANGLLQLLKKQKASNAE